MKKKFIEITKFIAFLFALAIIVALTASCNDKIDVKNDYDFTVYLLPIPREISFDEPVEMRFEIRTIDGSFAGTRYQIRSFQYAGKGSLINEDGEVFYPNDYYDITNKKFRLYYTAKSGSNHEIELVFIDNFNHEKVVNLNFSVESTY